MFSCNLPHTLNGPTTAETMAANWYRNGHGEDDDNLDDNKYGGDGQDKSSNG